MTALILLLFSALAAFAQTQGQPVTITNYPVDQPTEFHDIDANGNELYVCYAKAKGPWNVGSSQTAATFTWTKAATTLTSIAVATNVGTVTTSTAHGLMIGNTVTVSGATVDTDLNATYKVLTIPSSTTFTITTVNVADATYTDAGLTMTTNAPRLTAPIWSILKKNFDGSNHLVSRLWANGTPAQANQICANRAVTTGATSIPYF